MNTRAAKARCRRATLLPINGDGAVVVMLSAFVTASADLRFGRA